MILPHSRQAVAVGSLISRDGREHGGRARSKSGTNLAIRLAWWRYRGRRRR